MKKTYEVTSGTDRRAIAEFMKREGQFLLPMVALVERTGVAIDEVIQVMGRATIEAVLEMSAEGVAGPKQAGKAREVPAYAAMRRPGALADRMLEILMAGVSTRKYGHVIGEMADTVGVSASSVSRETIEASERRRLFVIDGSKALKKAITQVFGASHLVQRCRNHKLRNVIGHLPKDEHPQVKAAIRAAWKLDAKDGTQKLEQLARWLERDQPSAAASLREGLHEMFTINRLGLPPRLSKCLGTTNVIDSTHSGVRQKTRRVTNWKNGAMALRWAAASFVETEKSYRRIVGFDQLWMLKAHLDDLEPVAEMKMAG